MTVGGDNDPGVSLFVGNIHEKVNEDLLRELFIQGGPVSRIHMPMDNATGLKKGFAFVDFSHSVSGEYAIHLFNDTPLFGRNISVRHSHRGGSGSTAPSPMYHAAKQQLDALQREAAARNAASRQASLSTLQSPSVASQYQPQSVVPSGGIPYRTSREHTTAGHSSASASPLLRSASYPAPPSSSQQASYFARSAEYQASRRSSTHSYSDTTPPERSYPRHFQESPQREYRSDSREYSDDRRRDYHQSHSYPDKSAPRQDYRDDRGPPHDGLLGSYPSQYDRPRHGHGYDFTPDRHHQSSRYHPYSRSGHPSQQAPPPDPNQRVYSRR